MGSELWDRILVRDKDVVSRRIGGELFLIPVRGRLADMGNIFAVSTVAEFIWDRLDGDKKLADVRGDVESRFDVGPEQAECDILEFIEELLAAGLICEEGVADAMQ